MKSLFAAILCPETKSEIQIQNWKVLEFFRMKLLLCHHVEASFQINFFEYNEQKTAVQNFYKAFLVAF